jgi:regulator of nonsense transcripts 1
MSGSHGGSGDFEDHFASLDVSSEYGAPAASDYSLSSLSQRSGTPTGSRGGSGARDAPPMDLDLDLSQLGNLSLSDTTLDQSHAHHHHARGGDAALLLDEAEEEEENLPEHACAYCGIHNTSCVVRCLVCNKW